MAVKDFSRSENQDHNAKRTPITTPDDLSPAKTTQTNSEQEDIKNAHATGDGSFGRSESSLPEDEAKKKQGPSTY